MAGDHRMALPALCGVQQVAAPDAAPTTAAPILPLLPQHDISKNRVTV